MIDTHAHIYLPDFNDEIHTVLDEAWADGIHEIFLPAINFDSIGQMNRLPEHKVRLHQMAGIHPCDVLKVVDQELGEAQVEKRLRDLLKSGVFCAVGEIGLDYYWDSSNKEQQQNIFAIQMRLAKEFDLPFVIHNRDSTDDMLSVVEQEHHDSMKGIWHCFNGTVEEGMRAIELGLHLGIGGVATFKNAGVDKTVAELPLDRMVLETDSPYLTPAPFRGKKNYPKYIKIIAEKLAQIKGVTVQEIASITDANTRIVFG